MKAKAAISLCLLVIVATSVAGPAWGEGIRERRPNMVGGELAGRAPLITVNYERYFNNKIGIGAGLMGAGNADGFFGFFPIYLSLNPIGDTKSLYLSAGLNFIAGGGNDGDTESERLYTFGAAFQYQAEGGFVVRAGLYGLVPSSSSDDFLVLPGVTLAGSF
jgi:hypothetical protein